MNGDNWQEFAKVWKYSVSWSCRYKETQKADRMSVDANLHYAMVASAILVDAWGVSAYFHCNHDPALLGEELLGHM